MDNAEEILQYLEEFTKRKPRFIPPELNEYLAHVARTGDPVFQWNLVKSLFKEKLINVITDFYETSPGIDIPPCPNVDPFNYDIMKNSLLERLDTFASAPFTVQRICELLIFPRKQYNRIDKFMRAVEKNILVVSTREPGVQRHHEAENGDASEPMVNGSDNNSDYSVDVEMEDMSWKESGDQKTSLEPQPGSSDSQITVDEITDHPQPKKHQFEEENKAEVITCANTKDDNKIDAVTTYDKEPEPCTENHENEEKDITSKEKNKTVIEELKADTTSESITEQSKMETNETLNPNSVAPSNQSFIIPSIVIEDTEMIESKSVEIKPQEQKYDNKDAEGTQEEGKEKNEENPVSEDDQSISPVSTDENSCSSTKSDLADSDESISESKPDTDGENSNNSEKSPIGVSEETSESSEKDIIEQNAEGGDSVALLDPSTPKECPEKEEMVENIETLEDKDSSNPTKPDEYSIKDVNSEIPQVCQETPKPPLENTDKVPECVKVDEESSEQPEPLMTDDTDQNK